MSVPVSRPGSREERGTQNEDQITIKAKGETAEEAAAGFEFLLERYEAESSDRCRNIQPSKENRGASDER